MADDVGGMWERLDGKALKELSAKESMDVGSAADIQRAGTRTLKQLVTFLRLPDEFSESAEVLLRQAEEAFSRPDHLTAWLTELSGVVRHYRIQVEQDRKALHSVPEKSLDRLAFLKRELDTGLSEQQTYARKLHALDHRLELELGKLLRALSDARDMPELWERTNRHADALVHGLKVRRRLNEQGERAMKERYRAIHERVEALERENEQLQANLRQETRRAVLDPLTRLPNRRAFQARIDYEHERQLRRERPLSLMLCALHELPLINEHLGPEAGDVAIAEFAEQLSELIRPGDFVARLDGVEFVVVLPDLNGEAAMDSARLMGDQLERGSFDYQEVPFSLSAIFGVAEFRPDDTPSVVLRRARQALNDARAAGENRLLAPLRLPGVAEGQPES